MTRTDFLKLTLDAKITYLAVAALETIHRRLQLSGDIKAAGQVNEVIWFFTDYLYFDPFDELEDIRYYSSYKTGRVCDFILPPDMVDEAEYILYNALVERGGLIPDTPAYDCMEMLNRAI